MVFLPEIRLETSLRPIKASMSPWDWATRGPAPELLLPCVSVVSGMASLISSSELTRTVWPP